jgi:hypothetical protein
MKKLFSLVAIALLSTTFVNAQSFSTVHTWMFDNGLTTLTQANFRPADPITRGEAAKNFNQMAGVLGLEKTRSESECQFNDLE